MGNTYDQFALAERVEELAGRIYALLAERFAADTPTSWLDRLEAAEIPCGATNDILSALASPQAQARSMDVAVEHPRLGPIRQVGIPFKLSGTPATIRSAPPLIGEHSEEILAELGYEATEIDRLRADRVI
jgi:crotonobetainyl-CoA:carnitine CoA-transferase CaiB-like acyl-CoA transferase